MFNTRKSIYQQHQETDLATAWAARIHALLTLPDRNFGGLAADEFDLADAHYKSLRRKQRKN